MPNPTAFSNTADLTSLAEAALDAAKAAGADAADTVVAAGTSTAVTLRNGVTEEVERSEGAEIGLRVFVGARSALVGVADQRDLAEAAARAVAMAKAAPEDDTVALAPADQLAKPPFPDLDLDDGVEPDVDALTARARTMEEAMLAVAGVTNSNGVSAGARRATRVLATSTGFLAAYGATMHHQSATAIAGDGTRMERDSWSSVRRHLADLAAADEIGRIAAERTVRKLDARQLTTRRGTIIFEPRAASGFVGHLLSAVNGAAVARGASILAGKRGTEVMADTITIRDDPALPRGRASRPFDGEGLAAAAVDIVSGGTLQAYILDLSTARRLGETSNGRAARGTGSPSPAPTNVTVTGGSGDLAALMAEAGSGVLVTDLIGMGANVVNGNYSRGAAGFWFENGEIAYPVAEITVAGSLAQMFAAARFGDDAPGLASVDAPSIAIAGMTIGGR
ncbi:TldD/PmbA family protein [Acuticoccus sp. I52.16.1]|uniref:TldD/PmbA family protein n=1 Tax=Acuticoccus sp. I52.16.1 TaxID=2928472 RepID=UPI001FD4CC76|nr:TldD/PmbA family protein [Acuticoccus sp. I52.16.1]UOM36250.1 TldD/PmbA family protein [Acuticoccus sp. I52.16.1]